jgi:hypothetical protein
MLFAGPLLALRYDRGRLRKPSLIAGRLHYDQNDDA